MPKFIRLSFEYRYITNIWDDVTVEYEHNHKFNMTSDVDRSVKESELRKQANNILIELTNSLFPGDKKLELCVPRGDANFHAPVIKIESVRADHWAGIAILKNGIVLKDDPYIYDFVKNVQGTYAQIDVANGPFIGTYEIAVQTVE